MSVSSTVYLFDSSVLCFSVCKCSYTDTLIPVIVCINVCFLIPYVADVSSVRSASISAAEDEDGEEDQPELGMSLELPPSTAAPAAAPQLLLEAPPATNGHE